MRVIVRGKVGSEPSEVGLPKFTLTTLATLNLVFVAMAAGARGQTPDGAALFQKSCAVCHAGADTGRAPTQEALRAWSTDSILTALVSGSMAAQAAALSDAERRTLAEYLSGRESETHTPEPTTAYCSSSPVMSDPMKSPRWIGWGATIANARFQSGDQAGLSRAQVPALKVKWAFGFPGASSARAQPAIASGRVFVGSEAGIVYALDAETGCIHWRYSAQAAVRTGISIRTRSLSAHSMTHTVFFGDLNGHVYSLDAQTGRSLWVRRVDDHSRARIAGTPTLFGNRLYVPVAGGEETPVMPAEFSRRSHGSEQYVCCTFRGGVVALDADTGALVWKTYTIDEEPRDRGRNAQGLPVWGPAGASVWSAPTVDAKRRLVYVGTGNMFSGPQKPTSDAILALDLESGRLKWASQRTPADIYIGGCHGDRRNPNCPEDVGPDFDFGSSPILVSMPGGRDLIVAGQKSGIAWALDPDRAGAVVWQYRAGKGGLTGGIQWGAAADGTQAYFPISDTHRDVPGGLHAVRLATGERAWHTPAPPPRCGSGPGCSGAQPGAISVIPGVVFSGSYDGVIRAYSTDDGSIIWEYYTNHEFKTANGVKATGGSISGPGPVVAGGMVYVNSGYGFAGGRPGNVLLAFDAATPAR